MLIGAIIASVGVLMWRSVLRGYAHEAKVLTRKGIAPESMTSWRVRHVTARGGMWLFGAIAIILWVRTILQALL